MDLAYPSQQDPKLTQNLSQLDKMYKSILMSVKDLPNNVSLPKQTKSRINRLLQKDNAYKLSLFLRKQAITFTTQVGTTGSNWNILHLCVKHNAIDCLEYILKTQYQEFPQGYFQLLNSRTVQGYTPTVVSIINKADDCLNKILEFGGIDIHAVDVHKMTPYQIALNYKNQHAIKSLMNYQNKSKKKKYVNYQLLSQPIVIKHQIGFCDKVSSCLISCFSLGMYKEDDSSNKPKITERLSTLVTHGNAPQQLQIDYVQIGSRKQLPGYDIKWKRACQVITAHNISLFENYNPMNICENNFTLRHNLIILQQISKHPWLLRKLITPDKNKPNNYAMHIYPNMANMKIKIDDHIPFIKQRNQPMFISNSNQMWPMLVQKGLAKWHQGYFNLGNRNPKELLVELTGCYTLSINTEDLINNDSNLNNLNNPNNNIYEILEELNSKGYAHVLCGKKDGSLTDQSGKQECFNVLNFYQKGDKKYILVNCPFILQSWKQKQKYELLQMKVIKGHYNNHNQMCVWIDSQRFNDYFSKLVISHTLPNYQRSELKIKTNKYVFFKFRIESHKPDDMIVGLFDSNSLETYDLNDQKLQGWRNQGSQYLKLSQPEKYFEKLANIPSKPGQYMCKFQFDDNSLKNLLLVCWSVDYTQLEFVQEEFAVLEWLGSWKKHMIKTWKDGCPYKIERLGEINMVILREERAQRAYLRANISQNNLFEGNPVSQNSVEMVKDGRYFYVVFKGFIDDEQLVFDYE